MPSQQIKPIPCVSLRCGKPWDSGSHQRDLWGSRCAYVLCPDLWVCSRIQPPTISPEQQLMLGLASANRNAISPQGKFHYSPRCDFHSWYKLDSHNPFQGMGKCSSLPLHNTVHLEAVMLPDTAYHTDCSHTAHHMNLCLICILREKSKQHSVQSEMKAEPILTNRR